MSKLFAAEIRNGVLILPPHMDLSGFPEGPICLTLAATTEVPAGSTGPPAVQSRRPPGPVVHIPSPHIAEGAAGRRSRKRRLPAGQGRGGPCR